MKIIHWTAYQINFLIENAAYITDAEMAKILNRTKKAVKRKRENLGIKKVHGRGLCDVQLDKEPLINPKYKHYIIARQARRQEGK